ncbi:MAG: NAD(P)-dependent alcohol dehydrogenase [Bryobacterales bacterium]|jgi:NADPH:quinone reductase-like Zn-dependent oxidoreductase|nr:NAD(P)-dependent alcohol dehydrogenase [Bryobacterales bacterium]
MDAQATASLTNGQTSPTAVNLAIWQARYGGPETLTLQQRPIPQPNADEVLVRVHTASLEVADCFMMQGAPILVRPASGIWKPALGIPGMGLSGTVVQAGAAVSRFRPGDEVFGCCVGACATYAKASHHHLVPKPRAITWQQAAASTGSALAALHALRDTARIQPGQKILIIGAGGGIGSFAVQLARHYGAQVTGVCSTANVPLVQELGAHRVIDYTHEDFTHSAQRYDVILDNVENRPLAECRNVLAPDGLLICNSGTGAQGLAFAARLLKPILLNPFTRQKLKRYLSMPNPKDLAILGQMVVAGILRPVIGRTYPLHQTPDALRYIQSGHARGKVLVEVAS